MSETKNYKLYVTDDSSERFQDVRTRIYGETDSNMVKVDEILAQKADASQILYATLSAGSWSDDTQTLKIDGLTITQNGFISVSPKIESEVFDVACDADLYLAAQDGDILTVRAKGVIPVCDIPVAITIIG